ncbi:MAG: hypothetical protein PWQ15_1715 [Methanobacterium sp.]|uniref:hypothetical protein n=1 Tax=Methanobacterium sp. TaxID=2164 RepID=UPI0024AA3B33|nr:hypothetical protein [Methanobacterium sp.]MDI3550612.1 hypothetical protein [Methanobacterium sp.]
MVTEKKETVESASKKNSMGIHHTRELELVNEFDTIFEESRSDIDNLMTSFLPMKTFGQLREPRWEKYCHG